MTIKIRHSKSEELSFICHVHEQAFKGHPNEVQLVAQLHAANKVLVSFVATLNNQVVAHVLFSPVTLHPPRSSFCAVALGPIGVHS